MFFEGELIRSAEANLAIVQEIYTYFGQGNVAGILEHFLDAIEFNSHYPTNVPYGGVWQGKEGFVKFLEAIEGSIQVSNFQISKLIVQDDTVVALGFEEFTVKATESACHNEWVHVWTLADAKVVKVRTYNDTAAVSSAF